MTLIQFLSHPIFTFVAGLAVSFFLYFRQKHLKRLSYELKGAAVVSPRAMEQKEKLEIFYDGKIVPRVTQTRIRFWNSGTETIQGSDIAKANRLRWALPAGGQVLSQTVEVSAHAHSQVSLKATVDEDQQAVEILFDYLDKGDGAIIAILHTGLPSDGALKGSIRGIPRGPVDWGSERDINVAIVTQRPSRMRSLLRPYTATVGTLMFTGMCIFSIFLLVSGLNPDIFLDFAPSLGKPDETLMLKSGQISWPRFLMGVFFTVFSTLVLVGLARAWWTKPPKRLR